MLKFNPPSIKEKMISAKRILEAHECQLGDWCAIIDPNFDVSDFDPSDFEDETISYSDEVAIWVPQSDESPYLSIEDIIDLSEELESATLDNNTRYISSKRVIQLIEPIEDTKLSIMSISGEWPNDRLFEQKISINGNDLSIGIVNGFTPFALKITQNGDYEDYWPPFYDNDYFIEIVFDTPLDMIVIEELIESFLFELNSSLNLTFKQHIRPVLDNFDYMDAEKKAEKLADRARLRPLLNGKGMKDLCHLFNNAIAIEDNELRLFSLVKVIEFIAPTVVKKKTNEQIRQRLLSADALNPDADFIADLIVLIENNRESRKDAVALKLTILEACDPVPLIKIAPNCLKKIPLLKQQLQEANRKSALEELSNYITATRNKIAHAKSNFKPTGRECPENQLSLFVECVRVIAIQAIRWFSTCPDELKIVNNELES